MIRETKLVLAVFAGTFMVMLDISIVTVALPSIQDDLSTGLSGAQWVVDGYTLCLAALMLAGGGVGDRFGRKRAFLTGMALFAAASALCAAATGLPTLVAGRVLQGIGSALIVPGALSLLAQAFPDPARRARMIGLWGASASLAFVLGPVLGGVLTDQFGWPAIFLINLPVCAAALILGRHAIPESADPDHAATDPAGQLLAVVWLGALTFAAIEGGHHGWSSARTVVPLLVAVAGFAAFLAVELGQRRPMVPVRLFGQAGFAVANLATFVLGFAALASGILLTLFLQQVKGYSATEAGAAFLPYSVALAAGSVLAGRLAARGNPWRPVAAGYLGGGLSLLAMMAFTPDTAYPLMGAVFLLGGLGIGMTIAPTTVVALAAVPQQRSGIASATVNAMRQTGLTVGVAVLGSVLANRAIADLAEHMPRAAAAETVAGGGAGGRLFADAFTSGLHTVAAIGGTVMIAVAVLTAVIAASSLESTPSAPVESPVGR